MMSDKSDEDENEQPLPPGSWISSRFGVVGTDDTYFLRSGSLDDAPAPPTSGGLTQGYGFGISTPPTHPPLA